MLSISRLALACSAISMVACGTSTDSSAVTDEALSRDLALAASEAIELAPRTSDHAMAAVEVPPPATDRRKSSARPATPPTEPAPETVSVEPADIVAIADEPRVDESPVEMPAEAERPAPSRRPRPIPVDYPVGGDDGPDDGGGIGAVIGVVIRGGAVGDDDCDLHRRPRPGIGVMVGGVRPPVGIGRGPTIAINERIPRRTIGFPR